MLRFLAALTLPIIATACSSSPNSNGPGNPSRPEGMDPADLLFDQTDIGDGTRVAVIGFNANATLPPQVRGNLVAGGKLIVISSLDRLDCRNSTDAGAALWDLRVGGHFDDGTKIGEELTPDLLHSLALGGPTAGELVNFSTSGSMKVDGDLPIAYSVDVPLSAAHLQLYLHNLAGGDTITCEKYDSGAHHTNYSFDVHPANANDVPTDLFSSVDIGDGVSHAVIGFEGDNGSSPQVRGHLKAGGKLTVVASLDRLRTCRGSSTDGNPLWTLRVGGQFDGGGKIGEELDTSLLHSVFDPSGQSIVGTLVGFPTSSSDNAADDGFPIAYDIDIPAGTKTFDLYLHNLSSVPSPLCESYDSKNSANYSFTTE